MLALALTLTLTLTLTQLQGNLLFSMLEPRWPQLAGKITGK